ncbi:tetratricopeptide repeat protein [Pedobacter sp.]|uniref:tetratricopeptide repeat protein n=1 Tax=Pedobacter sp. TaxID=1411316 RepID=UPI003D7FB0E2
MHNLTAKYNYLYHAHLILDRYESQQRDSYATNFEETLTAYIADNGHENTTEELDKVIEKTKTVIAEKSNTKYMADAYLLLAKANFLKGNYFLSQYYYEYVVQAYQENQHILVKGLDGQARSLLQLGKYELAKPILTQLVATLPGVKKDKAEPLAVIAQANIISHDFTSAITHLEASVKEGGTKYDRLRRTYIIAQLEENQKNYPKALKHYLKIQKSNAPFDLYFNAILSSIRINGTLKRGTDKKQQIKSLIGEDKTIGYTDQLYYELAKTYAAEQNYDQALHNYHIALKHNTTNYYQRGLIYQHIATINANQYKKYTQARIYADSSLKYLPKKHASYEQTALLQQRLQYLSSRYEIISLQDSLQRIAKLPEVERQHLSYTRPVNAGSSNTPTDPDGASSPAENRRQEPYANEATLPLTPSLLASSNHKIRKAYEELANFYLQDMSDHDEAMNMIQILSGRFPNSVHAQTTLNDAWRNQKAETEQQQLHYYNQVYQAYERKDYPTVINMVDKYSQSRDKSDNLAPQFLYLRALAIGRSNSVDELIKAFNLINQQYPNHQLISPIVQSHQTFIKQHLPDFQKRKTALLDTDPNEPPFTNKHVVEINTPPALAVIEPSKIITTTPIEPPGIFSKVTDATYYFVIGVSDASITLSPSRFGIGQFNRTNYPGNDLKHHLAEIDNEQLIYIGNFVNFADVKSYAEDIRPKLKQIMKVKESDYTSFIISQENFDKITSEALLKKYLEFYKNSY